MKSQSILLLLSILIFFALVICNIQKIRGECEKFQNFIKNDDLDILNNMSKINTRKLYKSSKENINPSVINISS